ncbi:MAG: class I SAM-dependent methyltransferase [Thermomicrobiales bacterium]
MEAPRTRKKQKADDVSEQDVESGAESRQVRRRKGVNQQEVVKTHGLPEPDGNLNKGRIFEAVLAPMQPGRLLDLGAGKGNFSMSAASLGWQVTAVDARKVRWPEYDAATQPELARLLDAVTFVQSDIRDYAIGRGDFDLICILGLLHHLEVPDQLALLRKCAGTPLLIDTRIASAIVDTVDEYEGMLIKEHGDTREERDEVATASWGNETSFRHTEESLMRLLRTAGYPVVFQARPPHRREYTFYYALPRATETGYRRNKRAAGEGKGSGPKARYKLDNAATPVADPGSED